MMVESRPLYLLLRLMRAPLRLRRRYQAHPLLTGTSNVVYIGMSFANQAATCHWGDLDLSSYHMMVESRPLDIIAVLFLIRAPLRLHHGTTTTISCKACLSLFSFVFVITITFLVIGLQLSISFIAMMMESLIVIVKYVWL